MKKRYSWIVPLAIFLLSSQALAGGSAHWGYSGHEGPSHWGDLSPEFRMCSEGKNQSPINLSHFLKAELAPVNISYKPGTKDILNNGHTIQVDYAGGSTITVDGHEFELKQFHFHAPSENQINGKPFAMEIHFVHADKSGNLAVVAVMLTEGPANALMEKLWRVMPEKPGARNALQGMTAADLLPGKRDYYRYNGSLTTPPCTEGVLWLVMKEPVTVSKGQVEKFAHTMHHPNNRPVQAVDARAVLK